MHLDGAQTFGSLDVNLQEIGPDSYSTSTHKWLMGPLEAGFLYVRSERIPQLWPSIVTAGWADDLKGARKFEVFGQRDDPRVAALEAAIDFVMLIGMPVVQARVIELAKYTKTQLMNLPNVELKTNMEPALSGGRDQVPAAQCADQARIRYALGAPQNQHGDDCVRRVRRTAGFAAYLQFHRADRSHGGGGSRAGIAHA
jgi:selenocysteine lyase/cysteine desulfurase